MSSKISDLIINTLEDYTNLVKDSYYNAIDMHSILMTTLKNVAQVEEQKELNLEIQCLLGELKSGEYIPMFESKTADGRIIKNPDIDLFTQEDLNLIKKQLSKPRNHAIKAQLAHILFIKKQGIDFAKFAIEEYINSIKFWQDLDNDYPTEHYGLEILNAFKNLEELCLSTNYNIDILVNLAINLAKNFNLYSTSDNVIKINTIEFLLNKRNKINIDNSILKDMLEICENYSSKDECESIVTAFLELGSRIDNLLTNNTSKWDKKYAEYYEKLSTKTADIQAPIYVQKALDYYKKLKNEDKVNELNKKYSFLCQNIQLNHYETKPIDLTKYINKYIELVTEFDTEKIIKFLMYSSEMVPDYRKVEESALEILSQGSISAVLDAYIIDKYGHNVDFLHTEKEKLKYQIYQQYDIYFQIQSKLNFHFINKAIELKKLNAEKLINFLEKTWYGYTFNIKINNNSYYTYNWLDMIKEAIYLGFLKLESYVQNKESPLMFILEIDSLTLKIEGIIRDLILNSKIDGLNAHKFNYKHDCKLFSWKNINGYLFDPKLTEILPKDDIIFLRYFLVDMINLRNNTAHCLLQKPQEYDVYYFEYLIIILLRLARFKINEIT